MDYRLGRSVISPSSASMAAAAAAAAAAAGSSGLMPLFPAPPHHPLASPSTLHPGAHHPLFYYPGLPLPSKLGPPPGGLTGLTSPVSAYPTSAPSPSSLLAKPALNGLTSYGNTTSAPSTKSSSASRTAAAVQPIMPSPVVARPSTNHQPASSPLHRSGTVTSPPTGSSRLHNPQRSSVSPASTTPISTTTSNNASNGFAAALRHLANHAGINHADAEAESLRSPSRSSYMANGVSSGASGPSGTSGPGHPPSSSSSSASGYRETSASLVGSNGSAIDRTKSPSRSPHPHHHHRPASSSSRKEASGSSSAPAGTSSKRHGRDETGSARARSPPPVVTIAPTLSSLSSLHYQDSRKGFDRGLLMASSGGFGGGLSTGLAGLQGLPSSMLPYSSPSLMPGTTTSAAGSANGTDYLAGRAPDVANFALPSPFPYPAASRADDLFYGGLRSSMQQSAAAAAAAAAASSAHFRPEESSLNPARSLASISSVSTSYHDSLLTSHLASTSRSNLLTQADDYLMSARGFNPYAASGALDPMHSNLYPFAQYRSIEEQLYLERYGLLRPPTSTPSSASYPPPLGFPSYINFRYPTPGSAFVHPDFPSNTANPPSTLPAVPNGLDSSLRLKQEEEQKGKLKEEEASKDSQGPSRPLATVTPRETSSSAQGSTKEKEKHKSDKSKRLSDGESRKSTVQLPNGDASRSSSAKVHTVSPLYASYPVLVEPLRESERSSEFSLGALEAMAVLKQRSVPSNEEAVKREESVQRPETVPLDLSEPAREPLLVMEEITAPKGVKPQMTDPSVKSLLDFRVERWRRRKERLAGEEDDDLELDEEILGLNEQLPSTSLSLEQCVKLHPVPASISKEQHEFLHMFGLTTPAKRNNVELRKIIRRHNVLRDPTPPPADADDEDDSATRMLKEHAKLSAELVRPIPIHKDPASFHPTDPALCQFAAKLDLRPADPQTIERVEKSWSVVVADRMRRHLRKRSWGEAFRPLEAPRQQEANGPVILKPIPQHLIPKNGLLNKAIPELPPVNASDDFCSEATKLTSEVAFWLRHLKPTLTRSLTSAKEVNGHDTVPSATNKVNNTRHDDEESDEEEPLTKWPGVDSVMVLYMNYQQEMAAETKYLREHCERLHVQLAEGQATLSKLCLALSSSVETQRRCKEEDSAVLRSINELQATLKLLR